MRPHFRLVSAALMTLPVAWGVAACSERAEAPVELLVPRLTPERPTEVVRFGAVDSGELEALQFVAQVNVGPDGLIYVLDRGRRQVLVLDRDGRVVRTVGREGVGPGEFGSPTRMGFLGDTLWIHDNRTRSVTKLSLEGEHLDRDRWEMEIDAEEFRSPSPPLALLPRGGALFEGERPLGTAAPDATGPVLLVDLASDRRDTLAVREVWRGSIPLAGGTFYLNRIETYPLVAWNGTGALVAVVERAADHEGGRAQYVSLDLLDPSGGVTHSHEIGPLEVRPVSAAERDRRIEQAASQIEITASRIRSVGDRIRNPRAHVDRVLIVPDYHPLVDDARADHLGRVWLRLPEPRLEDEEAPGGGTPEALGAADRAPTNRWLLVHPGRAEPRLVDLPEEFELHDADEDFIWGVTRDSLNVQYVVGLRRAAG